MNIKELYKQSYINGLAKKEAAPYKGAVGRHLYALRDIFSKGTLDTVNKQFFPKPHYKTAVTLDNLKGVLSRYQDMYLPDFDHAYFLRHMKKHPGVRELLNELRQKDLRYASELRKKGLPITYNKLTAEVNPELFSIFR